MHTFCKNYNNYIVLLLITFSQTVFAHNGSIQGNISQQSNGQPVSDALIYVTELSTTTFTNTFGNYTIRNNSNRCDNFYCKFRVNRSTYFT